MNRVTGHIFVKDIILTSNVMEPAWISWAKEPPAALDGLEGCRFNSLLVYSNRTAELRYAYCNRFRFCRRCAERIRRLAYVRLKSVVWDAFITLHMPSEHGMPTSNNIRRQSKSLGNLLASVRKNRPAFKYAWVREISKGGRLHLHMVWTLPWIDQAELKMLALDAGFGSGAYIESLHTPGTSDQQVNAASYLAKSLARIATDIEGAWPEHVRRYKLPPLPKSPKRPREWLPWMVVRKTTETGPH